MTRPFRAVRLAVFAAAVGLAVPTMTPAIATGDQAAPAAEPKVCSGCTPPLTFKGGPVMGTPQTPGAVTITPIFWDPSGNQFPASYLNIVDGYIGNIAADSGKGSNVYSVPTEYSQIQYSLQAGQMIDDTDALPANGCPPAAGMTACITDAQLQTEVAAVLAANQLPSDLAHLYPVFFPPGVETVDSDGSTSVSDFCGYHSAFGNGPTVYTDEPYGTPNGCGTGQAPNGDVNADSEVGVLSHEIAEAITDPTQPRAWDDSTGNEIGDQCNQYYGRPIGSTDPNNPQTTEYNQVINGAQYYTQLEFSNTAFNAMGVGQGCIPGETAIGGTAAAVRSAAVTRQNPNQMVIEASPDEIAVNGSSTVSLTVYADNGEPVAHDHVHFDVADTGDDPAPCGTMAAFDGFTNANGEFSTTYRGSSSNSACVVIASEALTGASDQTYIYQGSAAQDRPQINATAPAVVVPGAPPVTFTMQVANPSRKAIPDASVDLVLFGNDTPSSGVTASQVHLSFMDSTTGGQFKAVPLSGETTDGGEIDGFLPPEAGFTFAAGAQRNVTFKLSIDASTPTSLSAGSSLSFVGFIDQINPADASLTTLNYTSGSQINVASSAGCGSLENALALITNTLARATLQQAIKNQCH